MVENTYASGHGGATGGLGEVGDGADDAGISWAPVRGGADRLVGVGGEEMGLGAGEAIAFFASTAICGSEDGSRGANGDKTELGAGAGEEWSGVQNVGVDDRCGETGRERLCTGVGEDAGVKLSGGGDRVGRGGKCRGGECRGGGETQVVVLPNASQQLHLAAPFAARARGPAGNRVAMVGAMAVWPAGTQAGSEVLRAATALQHWRPDCDDEGVCGSISGLRRWWLEFGKLARFLGVLQSC